LIAKLHAMPDSEPSSSRSRTPDRFTPDDADGDGCSKFLSPTLHGWSEPLYFLYRDIAFLSRQNRLPASPYSCAITPYFKQRRELAGDPSRSAPNFID
jgi:hypothetical protein